MSFSIEKSFSRKLRSSVQCRECEDGVLDGNTWEFPKGLGHAMLGNFSTDQMVIELTKIHHNNGAKTVEDLKQNTRKPRKDIDGQNWRGLKWIVLGPAFFARYTAGRSFLFVIRS